MDKVRAVRKWRRKVPEDSNRWSLLKFFESKYRQIVAIFVRCLLLIHSTMAVWLLVSMKGNKLLWCLLVVNVLLVMETVFTVVKREGKESSWFCPALMAYLAVVLPPAWMVELDHLHRNKEALMNSNLTLIGINGLALSFKLEHDVWPFVMEQTLLFMLVVCRWLLPRGDISRHELSQLLFVFAGIASDNVELFVLFEEPEVQKDATLIYGILGIWSLSLLQFPFVLTSTKDPQNSEIVHDQTDEDTRTEKGKRKQKVYNVCEVVVTTEIWSLLFSVLVQDAPYAGIRIYAVIKYNINNHTIIFFICKNILIIFLVLYRFLIICINKSTDDDTDDEDNNVVSEKRLNETAGSKSSSNTRNIKMKPFTVTTRDKDANVKVKPTSMTTRDNDLNMKMRSNSKTSLHSDTRSGKSYT